MKRRLYIEAGPLLEERMSGIGHTTHQIVSFLSHDTEFLKDFDLYLLAPRNKMSQLKRFHFNDCVNIKYIPIRARFLNGLAKFNALPPMDVLFGRGVYLFPNFKNWPLMSSSSITYIHDVSYRIYPQFVEPSNLKMLQKAVPRFLKRTTHIVTVSNSSKMEILGEYPFVDSAKVHVVYNGVDLKDFYRRTDQEVAGVRNKYGIPEKYFIFLSNIEPRKNIETILDAYKEMALAYNPRPALVLIGGMGWLNESVIKKINDMNMHGFKVIKPSVYVPDTDLPALLSGSVAMVHAPWHEGFGISPLQALACELPVIVSPIPALQEVMAKEAIYMSSPDDTVGLARHMKRVYDYGITEERRRKFRGHAEKYAWDKQLLKLKEVIYECSK